MITTLQHDMLVIGTSAGGVEALTRLVGGLPADLHAAVLIVIHIPAHGTSLMPAILSRNGPLPAKHPVDGEALQLRQTYVAPPDHHLMIERERLRVVRGPNENRYRPAVDVLFRSAALAYSPCCG